VLRPIVETDALPLAIAILLVLVRSTCLSVYLLITCSACVYVSDNKIIHKVVKLCDVGYTLIVTQLILAHSTLEGFTIVSLR